MNASYAGLDDIKLPHEGNNTEILINGIAEGSLVSEERKSDFKEDEELNGCPMDDEPLEMMLVNRYHVPKTNDWCMHANYEVDGSGQSPTTVVKIDESVEVRYDEECLSDEDTFEFLQQKECIDALLNKGKFQYEYCDTEKDEHNNFLGVEREEKRKEKVILVTYLKIVRAEDNQYEQQLLEVVTTNEEEVANQKPLEEELQSLEDWQLDDVVDEESVEVSSIIQSESIDLYKEINLLGRRLPKQKAQVQYVKLKLKEE